MDHVVYLDHKAKELHNLIMGRKNMIVRGAMGRKVPYKRAKIGDCLYFVEKTGLEGEHEHVVRQFHHAFHRATAFAHHNTSSKVVFEKLSALTVACCHGNATNTAQMSTAINHHCFPVITF